MFQLIAMLVTRSQSLADRMKGERGATATEYGILVAVVAITLVTFVTAFFTGLGGWLEGLVELLPGF